MKSIRNWVCCLFKFEFRGPRWKLAIRIFVTLTFVDSVMHRFFVIVSINMLLWKKREKKTFHGCCLLGLLGDNGDKEHSSLTQQRIQLFRRHTVYYSSLQDEGLSTAWAVYIGVCCVLRAAGVFVHLSFAFDFLLASLSMALCVWLGRDTLAANDQASSCVVLVNDRVSNGGRALKFLLRLPQSDASRGPAGRIGSCSVRYGNNVPDER